MSDSKIYKLVLYPINVGYRPENWNNIQVNLARSGFIGSLIPSKDKCFFVGERFLQLITFLGCSPDIQLSPEDGDDDKYCRVELSDLSDELSFRYFERDVSARCPNCRKNIRHWSQSVKEWGESQKSISVSCEYCDSDVSIFDLNWRHNAAFARCFIDVWHIYPQEAIPTEELLKLLLDETEQEWDYFFSDSSGVSALLS